MCSIAGGGHGAGADGGRGIGNKLMVRVFCRIVRSRGEEGRLDRRGWKAFY